MYKVFLLHELSVIHVIHSYYQHGLSEFHSIECHSIAKYTAVVATGMSRSVSLCDLINFNFSALRGHKSVHK